MARPPATDYEAEVRARAAGTIDATDTATDIARAQVLNEAFKQYKSHKRRDEILVEMLKLTNEGEPLAEAYAREKLSFDDLVGRGLQYEAEVSSLANAATRRVEAGELSVPDAGTEYWERFLAGRDAMRRPRGEKPAPVVTIKKAEIVITREGVQAVPIKEEPEVADEKLSARDRLRDRLTLDRIDESMAEPQPEQEVATVESPLDDERNFDQQQELMNRLPVGRTEGMGTLTAAEHSEVMAELDQLRERLPQESKRWAEIAARRREEWQQKVDADNATQRESTIERLTAIGLKEGDEIGVPIGSSMFGGMVPGTGKLRINKRGHPMVSVPGKQMPDGKARRYHLWDVQWWRPGEAPADATPETTPEPAKTEAAKETEEGRTVASGEAVVNREGPIKPKPVKVEQASETELFNALKEMYASETEETNLLYSDGATGPSKMARMILRMVEVLMIDNGVTNWPQFADRVLSNWGDAPGSDRVTRAMRDWYEAGREARVAENMTPVEEIDRWYRENVDVVESDRVEDAGREDAAAVPEPEPDEPARPVGDRDGEGGRGEVPPADEGRRRDDQERGARDRDSADGRGSRDRSEPAPDTGVESTDNWQFEPGALAQTELRGPSQKARNNVEALELLKQLQREGRQATAAEQEVLSRYVGWGGLKTAFQDQLTGEYGKGMEEVGARLKELLTDKEYQTARRSIQYAHYTSEGVISFMWDVVRKLGFAGGRVIEPGAGIGHFAGMMPPEVRADSGYFGIEMDGVTAGIAKQLYPNWSIRHQDFAKTAVPPQLVRHGNRQPAVRRHSPGGPKVRPAQVLAPRLFLRQDHRRYPPWRAHGVHQLRGHHEQAQHQGPAVPRRPR